jgi:GNAT superfamily N-acetyltransferase
MTPGLTIRALEPGDAEGCDAIIASLPYHFGDPHGRAECARVVRAEPGLAATRGGSLVGFLSWRSWFDDVREITWLAVSANHRRGGIGGQLVAALGDESRRAGRRYLVVTTLSTATAEPGVSDGYAGTRRFYHQHGFVSLWEPGGWWSAENQAVVLLCDLDRAAS